MSKHPRTHRAVPFLLSLALLALLTGCGLWPQMPPISAAEGQLPTTAPGVKVHGKVVQPFDIQPYLHPKKKYLGVALPGIVGSSAPLADFTTQIGKAPNQVEFYSAWGDQFEAATVESNWKQGAMSNIALEPNKTSDIADIISGKDDSYIKQYASAVRHLNLPVAISFGHEMNGNWRPWGRQAITPAVFVAAWKHIHDLFMATGATTVIWVWSPNQIGIISPPNPLKNYWPGDKYVDWVGAIGYYGQNQKYTFNSLFGPTLDEIRGFTKKPFYISETAAPPGTRKPTEIDNLFTTVAARKDVIGFNWFNYYKAGVKDETNWKVDSGPLSLAAFRSAVKNPLFGFNIEHP
jgi:hypothetical protein